MNDEHSNAYSSHSIVPPLGDEDKIIKFVKSLNYDINYVISVRDLACEIYYKELALGTVHLGLEFQIRVVSYLHDIDELDYNKARIFLMEMYPKYITEYYLNIVERTSYIGEIEMREKSGGQVDWKDVLGESGVIVRNMVSDAIKISLLGKEGYQEIKNIMKKDNKLGDSKADQNELFKFVDDFIKLRITTIIHYIHTTTGRKMAIHKRSELYIEHEDWRKKLINL